jgi:hypothetical protein
MNTNKSKNEDVLLCSRCNEEETQDEPFNRCSDCGDMFCDYHCYKSCSICEDYWCERCDTHFCGACFESVCENCAIKIEQIQDYDIALEYVKKDGHLIKFLNDKIKSNYNISIESIRNKLHVFEYISPLFRGNYKIIREFISSMLKLSEFCYLSELIPIETGLHNYIKPKINIQKKLISIEFSNKIIPYLNSRIGYDQYFNFFKFDQFDLIIYYNDRVNKRKNQF